jgi:hypothetical protein
VLHVDEEELAEWHALFQVPSSRDSKALPPEYLKSDYKYASTQVNMRDCTPDGPAITNRILALARLIPDGVLAEDGREDNPHVTLKYGLDADTPAEVRSLLKGEHSISLIIGPIDVFSGEETGTDHDVIILRVYSPDLVRLNRKLSDEVDNTTTFSYNPHITLAYVKPGTGEDFVSVANAGNDLTGETLFSNTISFSSRDGKQTQIRLGGTDAMSTRLKYDVLASNIRQRLSELSAEHKGGAGSGNFGHGGRPGERGGSGGGGGLADRRMDAARQMSRRGAREPGSAGRRTDDSGPDSGVDNKERIKDALDAAKYHDSLRQEHLNTADYHDDEEEHDKRDSHSDAASLHEEAAHTYRQYAQSLKKGDSDPDKERHFLDRIRHFVDHARRASEKLGVDLKPKSTKGGAGSGNFGHGGRPGERGGSSNAAGEYEKGVIEKEPNDKAKEYFTKEAEKAADDRIDLAKVHIEHAGEKAARSNLGNDAVDAALGKKGAREEMVHDRLYSSLARVQAARHRMGDDPTEKGVAKELFNLGNAKLVGAALGLNPSQVPAMQMGIMTQAKIAANASKLFNIYSKNKKSLKGGAGSGNFGHGGRPGERGGSSGEGGGGTGENSKDSTRNSSDDEFHNSLRQTHESRGGKVDEDAAKHHDAEAAKHKEAEQRHAATADKLREEGHTRTARKYDDAALAHGTAAMHHASAAMNARLAANYDKAQGQHLHARFADKYAQEAERLSSGLKESTSSGHPQGSSRSGDKIGGAAEKRRMEVVANRAMSEGRKLHVDIMLGNHAMRDRAIEHFTRARDNYVKLRMADKERQATAMIQRLSKGKK